MARSASARSRTLRPNDVERIAAAIAPTTGYVAAGSVTISRDGGTTRVAIGETFAVPAATGASIANGSATAPARIVTFTLLR